MISDDEIKLIVLDYLKSKGDVPGKTESEQFAFQYLNEGLIDSMGTVEMILTFQDTFSIKFQPEHIQSSDFRNIGGLIQLIRKLTNNSDQ